MIEKMRKKRKEIIKALAMSARDMIKLETTILRP
jgi:hypothetical protein